MNKQTLGIYLNDHLALMNGELQLIVRCRSSQPGGPLRTFLDELESDVAAQQTTANDVRTRFGCSGGLGGRIKSSAAWIAEKVGRLKLNGSVWSYSPLSRVTELEGLIATACERIALWDTLNVLTDADQRLDGISSGYFQQQSEKHLETLQTYRRAAAVDAFLNAEDSSAD
ncbi:hypothetical protein [Thalassoroseus pseudoceratinae]|uniref:hypothetical protein n=1 Tax=Thalassoroseus pseudoceratinae TaxID=2713176 RepID=UPI00142290D7|nr:hypothetical protein [Thalassoroseus pseudoceratinae]